MGVGYIIGPKIAGVLVAGGVLSWFVFIPLLASLLNDNGDIIATQLIKLGLSERSTIRPEGPGGWDPATQNFGRLVTGHLPGLYQADWRRCCCSRWFYYIDKNNSYHYFFFQRKHWLI